MAWLHESWLRLGTLIKRRQLDRDLDDEIRFHLEMRESRNREAGMTPQEAGYAARRRFGNASRWKESIRAMWSIETLESLLQDLRYALRSLRKTPGFAAAAILVLALGIGSTTAIFSMVNAVLFRSLPFQDPDHLVLLWGNVQRQKVERRGASYPDFVDWKTQARSFDGMAAYSSTSFTLTGADEAERISGEWVSAGYFELLGIQPVVGRTITPDEDRPGTAARVILIGEGLWKRRFGSTPEILGTRLQLDQRQFIVIGVLPAWFRGLTDSADVWAPFTASMSPEDAAERGNRDFPAVARLKTGVPLRQAQVEMDGLSKRLEQAYPATNSHRAVEVAPLVTETVGDLRTPLMVLLGAVAFVLLIACANVASLLLARSETRRQEIAIRAALGASRVRVFRQLLTESVLLAATGAAFGLALAWWAVRLLTSASPISLPTFVNPQPDWTVAAFAAFVSVGVGLLVGVAPAWQAGKQDVHLALKESSSRAGEGAARQRVRSALVISEVAVAMMLLVGASLLMRSFLVLSSIEPGFDPKNVLTLAVAMPRGQAPGAQPAQAGPDQRRVVNGRLLLERIRALPSVVTASVAADFPFSAGASAVFYSAEGQSITDAKTRPRAYYHRVSPEFFATLRVPFVAGRGFTEAEIESRADVTIVTENLAKRFWPSQDPIGKRVKAGDPDSANPWWTIVGVVREMKFRGLPNNPTADPDLFLPLSQWRPNMAILIRSSLDPSQLTGAVRAAVHEVDASIAVYDVATMSERMSRAIEQSSFSSWMMGVFAALALALALIGLYGLMAYTVRQRTREFGIRIAMGASSGEVTGMVVRKGMLLVAAGITIGVVLAVVMARVLSTLLFGISNTDPGTFLGVAAILATVALIACYLPARRASRVDPITALRYE